MLLLKLRFIQKKLEENRNLTLEGEAYFQVQKDKHLALTLKME
jgi:hypothetical protein